MVVDPRSFSAGGGCIGGRSQHGMGEPDRAFFDLDDPGLFGLFQLDHDLDTGFRLCDCEEVVDLGRGHGGRGQKQAADAGGLAPEAPLQKVV